MAEQQKATSMQVARLAGVSQSAVSRAFTPGASVSEKMRRRVLEAARKLSYQPNAIARSLITRRSNMMGIVIVNITTNPFYADVLDALSRRFQEAVSTSCSSSLPVTALTTSRWLRGRATTSPPSDNPWCR
jgi:DNA-binding LacI/PurR family transcriptional regulator